MREVFIFPGWGTPKRLYEKLAIPDGRTEIITELDLKDNLERITMRREKEVVFLGWSLGAMRALEYLKFFTVDRLILLAPTLYFLDDQAEVIVKKMKRNLAQNKLQTLINFTRLNFSNLDKCRDYLQEYKADLTELDENYLSQGLNFLLKKDLRNFTKIKDIKPLIIVGKEDKVIENSSARKVLASFEGGEYFSFSGVGHNLIYEAEERVNNLIKYYLS